MAIFMPEGYDRGHTHVNLPSAHSVGRRLIVLSAHQSLVFEIEDNVCHRTAGSHIKGFASVDQRIAHVRVEDVPRGQHLAGLGDLDLDELDARPRVVLQSVVHEGDEAFAGAAMTGRTRGKSISGAEQEQQRARQAPVPWQLP